MTALYRYVNSVNILGFISLVILWVNKLFSLGLLTNNVVHNYVALTGVYAPFVIFILHLILIVIMYLRTGYVEYYQKSSAFFTFINMLIYLAFLVYVKYLY